MKLSAGSEDIEQMKRIETDVATLLLKYRGTTEVAIVAFALVRIARALLSKYASPAKRDLLDVCGQFLNGDAIPTDDPAARILTMQ
jgi:hypothetical protein